MIDFLEQVVNEQWDYNELSLWVCLSWRDLDNMTISSWALALLTFQLAAVVVLWYTFYWHYHGNQLELHMHRSACRANVMYFSCYTSSSCLGQKKRVLLARINYIKTLNCMYEIMQQPLTTYIYGKLPHPMQHVYIIRTIIMAEYKGKLICKWKQ